MNTLPEQVQEDMQAMLDEISTLRGIILLMKDGWQPRPDEGLWELLGRPPIRVTMSPEVQTILATMDNAGMEDPGDNYQWCHDCGAYTPLDHDELEVSR